MSRQRSRLVREEPDDIEDPDSGEVPEPQRRSTQHIQQHLVSASPRAGLLGGKKNMKGSSMKGGLPPPTAKLDVRPRAASTVAPSSSSPYASPDQLQGQRVKARHDVTIPEVKAQQKYSKTPGRTGPSIDATVSQLQRFSRPALPNDRPRRPSIPIKSPAKVKGDDEESSEVPIAPVPAPKVDTELREKVAKDRPVQERKPTKKSDTFGNKFPIPIENDASSTSAKKRQRHSEIEVRSSDKDELQHFQATPSRSHTGFRRSASDKKPEVPAKKPVLETKRGATMTIFDEEDLPQPPAKKPRIAKKEPQMIDLTDEKPSQALSLDPAPPDVLAEFDPKAPSIGCLGFQFGSKPQEARSKLISMKVDAEHIGFEFLEGNSTKHKNFDWTDIALVSMLEEGTQRPILAINFKIDGPNLDFMRKEDPSLLTLETDEEIPRPHFLAVAAYRENWHEMWKALPSYAPDSSVFEHKLLKTDVDQRLAGELVPMLETSVSVEKILHERQMTTRSSQQKAKSERKEPAIVTFPSSGADAVTLFQSDIDRLKPDELLNDSLIDFYLRFLYSELSEEKKREFLFFNSYFFKSIHSQSIRKWTKKVNIFDYRFIALPVNQAFHWKLAVICNPSEASCCILILDSLGSGGAGQVFRELRQYLSDEYRAKHGGKERIFDAQTCPGYFVNVPIQHNGIDCGVYMLNNLVKFTMTPPHEFTKDALNSNFREASWYEADEILAKRKSLYDVLEHLSLVQGTKDIIRKPEFEPEPQEEIEVLPPKPRRTSTTEKPTVKPAKAGDKGSDEDYINELNNDQPRQASLGDSQQRTRSSARARKATEDELKTPSADPPSPDLIVVDGAIDEESAAVEQSAEKPGLVLQISVDEDDEEILDEDEEMSGPHVSSKRKRSTESSKTSKTSKRPRKFTPPEEVSEDLAPPVKKTASHPKLRGSGNSG